MPSKKFNVSFAHRADVMMLSHTEFLARVSPNAAKKLLAEFKKVTRTLSEDPLRFAYADDTDVSDIPEKTYRKCSFYGRYKALFLVEGKNVYVDAIIDCRQENKNLY